MDSETLGAIAFMVFGLGFFLYVVKETRNDRREDRLMYFMERKEFGPPETPAKRRRFFS